MFELRLVSNLSRGSNSLNSASDYFADHRLSNTFCLAPVVIGKRDQLIAEIFSTEERYLDSIKTVHEVKTLLIEDQFQCQCQCRVHYHLIQSGFGGNIYLSIYLIIQLEINEINPYIGAIH